MRADIHQHLWTDPLIELLARRRRLPYVRTRAGRAVLSCAGEQPYVLGVETGSPRRRASRMAADGVERAAIALSTPVGIEALPRDEALPLIEAHLCGLADAGPRFAVWGPLALDRPEPQDVDRLVARGCVGVSIAAGALSGYDAIGRLGPVLERIAAVRLPLLVHPGPAPRAHPGPGTGPRLSSEERPAPPADDPVWWPALTGYVAQMHAAWLTFMTRGRHEHRRLVVVFAMLAGLAPLHIERLDARGGPPIDVHDPGIYYDTSSYGRWAIGAMARRVGAGQLLYGSDRPVVEPAPTGSDAALQRNSARFLWGEEAAA